MKTLLIALAIAATRPPPPKPPVPGDPARDPLLVGFLAVVNTPEHKAAMKACYEHGRPEGFSRPYTRVDIEVQIRRSGTVRRVVVKARPGLEAVTACLREEVSRWRFARHRYAYMQAFPLLLQGT